MKTNEIFEHVLQIVCEECELCYGELINGANKNAVDARCLLICALVSLGFSDHVGKYVIKHDCSGFLHSEIRLARKGFLRRYHLLDKHHTPGAGTDRLYGE